jgi:phosphoribosylanthranilate isomerase
MRAKVKICGITRGSDVRAAVLAGADALGFVFAPRSKRVLDAGLAAGLVRKVPAFVSRVGLFMDQEAGEVAGVLDRVPLNLLQFHGSEDADYCRQFGMPYMKAVSMESDRSVPQAVFDWALIPESALPIVLAGGLNPGNVREAVKRVRPWAVDVSSGVEDAPGIKNAEMMREFIREAKCEY